MSTFMNSAGRQKMLDDHNITETVHFEMKIQRANYLHGNEQVEANG